MVKSQSVLKGICKHFHKIHVINLCANYRISNIKKSSNKISKRGVK